MTSPRNKRIDALIDQIGAVLNGQPSDVACDALINLLVYLHQHNMCGHLDCLINGIRGAYAFHQPETTH